MANGNSLREGLREELKKPVGLVIPDPEVNREALSRYFVGHPNLTVTVGDRTTERMQEFGFSPDLEIVDYLEKRIARSAPGIAEGRQVLRAINQAGSISDGALNELSHCLELMMTSKGKKLRLLVKGEEDLLALPVIAFFPRGTVTFYGQPNVGLVIVDSNKSRESSRKILGEMGITSLPKFRPDF